MNEMLKNSKSYKTFMTKNKRSVIKQIAPSNNGINIDGIMVNKSSDSKEFLLNNIFILDNSQGSYVLKYGNFYIKNGDNDIISWKFDVYFTLNFRILGGEVFSKEFSFKYKNKKYKESCEKICEFIDKNFLDEMIGDCIARCYTFLPLLNKIISPPDVDVNEFVEIKQIIEEFMEGEKIQEGATA